MNEDFAYKITQKKEEVDETWEENFKQAISSEDFDEPWEQCLYRVCYVNPRQRPNATKYSRFLSDLRENYNIFCSIVTYPVVPKGVILLRLIPTAVHTLEEVEYTIKSFSEIKDKLANGEYISEEIASV